MQKNTRGALLGGRRPQRHPLGRPLAAPAQAATSAEAEEIQVLRDQVQALSDRLAAQEAALQRAQESQAQSTAQIETIPTQVQTAVAAMPKPAAPKKSWADDTVVSGRMYYDLSNITQKSDGKKVAPSGTGFDIKRSASASTTSSTTCSRPT